MISNYLIFCCRQYNKPRLVALITYLSPKTFLSKTLLKFRYSDLSDISAHFFLKIKNVLNLPVSRLTTKRIKFQYAYFTISSFFPSILQVFFSIFLFPLVPFFVSIKDSNDSSGDVNQQNPGSKPRRYINKLNFIPD